MYVVFNNKNPVGGGKREKYRSLPPGTDIWEDIPKCGYLQYMGFKVKYKKETRYLSWARAETSLGRTGGITGMKKFSCIFMALALSFMIAVPASIEGMAGEKNVTTQVIDMGDSVKVEALNMESGETEFLTLNDCTKTVETISDEDIVYQQNITLEGDVEFPPHKRPGRSGQMKDETDMSDSVRARIYAEYVNGYEPDGDDYIETVIIKYVAGQWEILDKSVSVYDKSYIYFCQGTQIEEEQYSGIIPVDDDVYIFEAETDFTEGVSPADPVCIAGVSMTAHLKRGDDTWRFKIDNLLMKNCPIYF